MQRIAQRSPTARIGIGLVVASTLAAATLVGTFVATRPVISTQPAPAAAPATRNHSEVPAGMVDYQRLQENALPRSNVSARPAGIQDYERLQQHALPRTNFSQVPAGFADYQRLRQNAPSRTNVSAPPAFMTDHQPQTDRATNYSTPPDLATDVIRRVSAFIYHDQLTLIDTHLAEANSAMNEALRAGNPR